MPRWLTALIALAVAILLCGGVIWTCGQLTDGGGAPATQQAAEPTAQPGATPMPPGADTPPQVPAGGVVLGANVGVFYGGPNFDGPPKELLIVEGGYSILAAGHGNVEGIGPLREDPTNINIVLFRGVRPDGSTPEDLNTIRGFTDYTAGAVSFTLVYKGSYEEATTAAMDASRNGMNPPNCGADACITATVYDVQADGTFTVTVYKLVNGQLVTS